MKYLLLSAIILLTSCDNPNTDHLVKGEVYCMMGEEFIFSRVVYPISGPLAIVYAKDGEYREFPPEFLNPCE